MERFAWKARVLPGKLDEYRKRHDEIWPEMTQVLNQAAQLQHLTDGETLFGYYECTICLCRQGAAESPVDRWNAYMKDVMVMEFDPETGTSVQMKEAFRHEGT